ncbi:MAG TPA: ROK family transcriptional regulator [Firmicutes bacterium]|nr:ROK family transcriptional regulator [Bacillota bacterium]
MSRPVNTTRLIRTYNASTVLRTLYRQGSCSRTQLAKLTGMSHATITRITAKLMEQGIVLEGRVGKSTGGRKPVYLQIDHSKLYIVSLKLLRDDCRAAILDLKGRILDTERLIWNEAAPEKFLTAAAETIRGMFARTCVNLQHIIGVGVAVSGICQSREGRIIKSVNLRWENVPLAELLSSELQLPVFIENDANACALAELWLGRAQDASNSMYLKTEEGAGAGIIANRSLLDSSHCTTGEVGHVPVIPAGEPCRCGQRGCLEAYVYFGDVQARYARRTGLWVGRSRFLELVRTRDEPALEIVSETAEALALACAHWGMLLDLDVITIGGFWGTLKDEVIARCQSYSEAASRRSGIPGRVTITGSSFKNEDADLLGAAGLVIDRWFDPLSVPFHR